MPTIEPPRCPNCPDRPWVWRDMTTAVPERPDLWYWYCAGCRGYWEPVPECRAVFAHGVPVV
ncbi:hypothetical protein [Streptomyces yaizuensis]|uniref:Transcription factor zinc-finger domain-containing protein n=1 Tax=Streptomyces yaizuensis TaxID=2989713 RepID=A0ABQ5PAY3_9ACTN|nr:hypothetical protein [Streptomyces sp. YSPA8]GLF99748.1 hypothetical protein SYYSPA8_35645 [Streptomyces sp. YSPA8]